VIELEVVKDRLHVVHDADDEMIQRLLDAAEDEALRFLNRAYLPTLPQDWPTSEGDEDVPSSDDPVAPVVVEAVCLLVMAGYGAMTADEMTKLRDVAFAKLHPYRVGLGV
jgi:hypothetical protein